MRHRFHSICPYFAMFPEAFAAKHLAASRFDGVAFDPFCGRGTAVFEALLNDRDAAGCDIHPVAVCISGAKADPPALSEVLGRLKALEAHHQMPNDGSAWMDELEEFFGLCFHEETLRQIRYLRSTLDWQTCRVDRFIAAVALGALHGESHRSPNYFSNQMPRTISTKPGYSIRWWRERNLNPPRRDVFGILRRMALYRFRTVPPERRGRVRLSDARDAANAFGELAGTVTDIITSPPYLDTTNYREDQWLRLWFLGNKPVIDYHRGDSRHYHKETYWLFLAQAWRGMACLLADNARLVVRIGGRRLDKSEARGGLLSSLEQGLGGNLTLVDDGVSSRVVGTQANFFRGGGVSATKEHDFCFLWSR